MFFLSEYSLRKKKVQVSIGGWSQIYSVAKCHVIDNLWSSSLFLMLLSTCSPLVVRGNFVGLSKFCIGQNIHLLWIRINSNVISYWMMIDNDETLSGLWLDWGDVYGS